MPTKRLYPATHPVFRGRRCQLDNHDRHRPLLSLDLHHQPLSRQTVCGPPGHLSGVPSDAVPSLSQVEQIGAQYNLDSKEAK
jgi:hypothetical protein